MLDVVSCLITGFPETVVLLHLRCYDTQFDPFGLSENVQII